MRAIRAKRRLRSEESGWTSLWGISVEEKVWLYINLQYIESGEHSR